MGTAAQGGVTGLVLPSDPPARSAGPERSEGKVERSETGCEPKASSAEGRKIFFRVSQTLLFKSKDTLKQKHTHSQRIGADHRHALGVDGPLQDAVLA